MNCCQMIDVANNYDDFYFSHNKKTIVSFLSVTIATFWILLEEIETGFCHLTKVLKRQQKLLEGKKRKNILLFLLLCIHTDEVFFLRSSKNFFIELFKMMMNRYIQRNKAYIPIERQLSIF